MEGEGCAAGVAYQEVGAAEVVFGLEEGEAGEDVEEVVGVVGGAEGCCWRGWGLWVGGVRGEAVGEGGEGCDVGG